MQIALETPSDLPAVERLLDHAFGPDRAARPVYRLREGLTPHQDLCFVLRIGNHVAASIRFWPILAGTAGRALLLGPIAVEPTDQGRGFGSLMIHHGLAAAKAAGHRGVLLIGDAPYYGRFGFSPHLTECLVLPGNPDQGRLLGLELEPGALGRPSGTITADPAFLAPHADRRPVTVPAQ